VPDGLPDRGDPMSAVDDELAELRRRVDGIERRLDVLELDVIELGEELARRRRWCGWWR
jgi:hypothetical protein